MKVGLRNNRLSAKPESANWLAQSAGNNRHDLKSWNIVY